MIRAIAAEFHVRSVITITTDNASNMVACGKLLAADGITRISCFAHSLQVAVNEGLNVPVISKMIAFAKRVVAHFSRSQPATKALLDHQRRMNAPKILNFIRDVETRWNSTYMLMKRLIQIRAHVNAVLYDETITKPTDRMSLDIKDSTWKVMELVLPILEPFVEATNMLTNDSLPTLGSQYVLIKALTDRIQVDELDSGCERDLKKVIASSFMKRFNVKLDGSPNVDVIKDSLHLICSFLDPRYKTLRLLSVEQREIVQDRVVEMMNVAHFEVPTVKSEPEDPPQAKHNLMDCLAGDFVDLTDAIDVTSQEIELEKYIVEPVAVRDPLDWWKSNEAKFPRLVTKKRASLDPTMVDELVFINRNYIFPNDPSDAMCPMVPTCMPAPPCVTATLPSVVVNESQPGPSGVAATVKPELPTMEYDTADDMDI